MTPEMTIEKNTVKLVNNLIELDYDAIEAYEAAIERLENADYKMRLEEFKRDHQRHITDLSTVLAEYGEEPSSSGDMKKVLVKGKVVIAGMAGDKQILQAMNSNEEDTNKAYEKAIAECEADPNVGSVLHKNLLDEKRHKSWIKDCLASLDD